jgi:hypothetical protein
MHTAEAQSKQGHCHHSSRICYFANTQNGKQQPQQIPYVTHQVATSNACNAVHLHTHMMYDVLTHNVASQVLK